MADQQEQDQQKHPGGRPLTFQSVAELDAAIQSYFDSCDPHIIKQMIATGLNAKGHTMFETREVLSEQRPYTMAGLARALGVDRKTLLNYQNRDEYFPSISAAKNRCEEYAEEQLFGPFANGAKFNLINNYQGKHVDWTDKQSVDHTTKDQPIPLLAGLAPTKLEVEDEDAAGSNDSPTED